MSIKTFALAVRAGIYMTGFVILWGWLALTVRLLDPRLGDVLPAWLQPLGLALILLGGMLALRCGVLFVNQGQGTPAPFDAPKSFVALGPYRWVRNPMYLGAFSVLLGVGLWLRSPAIALLSVGAGVLAHSFVLLYEEPTLSRRFGTTYAEYRRRVNRWWPRKPTSKSRPAV